MKRVSLLLAGLLVAIWLAGCSAKNPVGETVIAVAVNDKGVAEEESPRFDVPVSDRRIVGKWKVTNAARSIGRLPHAVFIEDIAEIAVEVISDGEKETETFDMVDGIDIDFRADGTCCLHAGGTKTDQEGTWAIDGDKLIQTYYGRAGRPGTVDWESKMTDGRRDKFMLVRADGPSFVFLRGW